MQRAEFRSVLRRGGMCGEIEWLSSLGGVNNRESPELQPEQQP